MAVPFPVTSFVAGACAILQSWLGARVGMTRMRTRTWYGSKVAPRVKAASTPQAQDPAAAAASTPVASTAAADAERASQALEYRMRAHQSSTENVPIALFVLAGLEAHQVMPRPLLAVAGVAFLVFRLIHSLKLGAPYKYPNIYRRVGYIGQLLLIVSGGAWLAVRGALGLLLWT